MALLGNYSVLTKNPGRAFAGPTVSDNRSNFSKSGAARGMFTGWAALPTFSSVPNGYRPGYGWTIAIKGGGMASKTSIGGSGAVSLNLAGGLNGVAALSGSGDLTNTAIQWIIQAVAAITATGDFSAAVTGSLNAAADLAGAGDVTGSLNALFSIFADLAGSGDLTGDGVGTLAATAALTGSGAVTAAALNGALDAIAALSGSGTFAGTADAIWNMVSDLIGSGEAAGTINALANLVADVPGEGAVSAAPTAKAFMGAEITVTGDLLTSANVGDAVWSAMAAANNSPGSMGERLNAAGSSGDPWGTPLPGSYPAGSAGYILSNTVNALLDGEVESSVSVQEALRALLAALTGKASGGGGPTITFRNPEDTADRVTMTVDESGNRSNVTLNL